VKKSILIFSISKLEDMKKKGNMSYIKHYEVFFDEVHMVYLFGKSSPVKSGKTSYVSLGSANSLISLFLAPLHLYKYSKTHMPTVYLTGDLIFSWWSTLLVKSLLSAKVFLMPVAMPHEIYESSGKTITGVLPRWIERLCIKFSFVSAYKIITGKNIVDYVRWLQKSKESKNKLLLVDTLVDELPSFEYFDKLFKLGDEHKREDNILLYVGRLHKEKLVEDVFASFGILKKKHKDLKLWIVGSGEELDNLKQVSSNLQVEEDVRFFGSKNASELPEIYKRATIFVSPLTGTSLREAGLASLPIVCYEIDWVANTFANKKEVMFAKKHDPNDLANNIDKLLKDRELCKHIVRQMSEYASKNWSPSNMQESLKQIYLARER